MITILRYYEIAIWMMCSYLVYQPIGALVPGKDLVDLIFFIRRTFNMSIRKIMCEKKIDFVNLMIHLIISQKYVFYVKDLRCSEEFQWPKSRDQTYI